jgi:hypothetical protein
MRISNHDDDDDDDNNNHFQDGDHRQQSSTNHQQQSTPSMSSSSLPPSSFSRPNPTTWIGWKERAKVYVENGEYSNALNAYTQALFPDMNCPLSEQQIVLSNMVACRLKLGGKLQAEAAIELSKRCIAINESWSKGHVRLASSYIAMEDITYSNDACRSLQRAIQLDPNNRTAKDMLIRELRRDHRSRRSSSPTNVTPPPTGGGGESSSSTTIPPTPSAPSHELDDNDYYATSTTRGSTSATSSTFNHPFSQASSSSSTTSRTDPQYNPQREHQPSARHQNNYNATTDARTEGNNNNNNANNHTIDERMSWYDKFQFYITQTRNWYMNQSELIQTFIKILFVLIALYVAFGGRFGLEYITTANSGGGGGSGSHRRAGNYHPNNVYEEFYRERNNREQQQQYQRNRGSSSDSTTRNDNNYHPTRYDPYEGTSRPPSSRSTWNRRATSNSNSLFGGNSFFGSYGSTGGVGGDSLATLGSLPNMILLGGLAFIAYRNGMNPFQVLFFANMAMGGGRGHRHHGGFGNQGMMMRLGRAAFGGRGRGGLFGGGGRPPRHGGGMWGW